MTTPGERISAIEARLEYLATKAELAEARGALSVRLSVAMSLAPVTIAALGIVVRNWPT